MASKYSPILWWPPKNIHKIFIPQKILIFLKIQKNIEMHNFEPPKMFESTYVWKYQSTPPPHALCIIIVILNLITS